MIEISSPTSEAMKSITDDHFVSLAFQGITGRFR